MSRVREKHRSASVIDESRAAHNPAAFVLHAEHQHPVRITGLWRLRIGRIELYGQRLPQLYRAC
jgi:hypothetical protein